LDLLGYSLTSLGEAGLLARAVVRELLTRRPAWLREALVECVFILRTVARPALGVNVLFAFSIIGLSLGVPLQQLGAPDRNAAFLGVGLIREFGVIMTASVLAGVVGTTYTAELGARKIRDELDALRVLGVDPVHALIVPRVVALSLMSPVILMLAVCAGAVGVFVSSVAYFGDPSGPFLPQLLSNTSWIDLWASMAKVLLFGFLIAVIACAKGLSVTGGAEGVGRAVMESVVTCLSVVFFVNIVYTQVQLGLFPDLSAFR
jgi:phospholipid/cholesterol/gamma-HCH transport system permease protein